jgi:hypothetical protein
MTAPMCAYTRGHDHACVYSQAWTRLRLCDHIRVIAPMCAYTRSHDCALCAYTCGHECTFVHIHIRVSMTAHMCAYTCRHDRTYVCIQAWARSRLCVHVRVCMIARICACACTHDRVYVCIHTCKPVCAYTCMPYIHITRVKGHVCVHRTCQRGLLLCAHTRVCLIALMCTCMCGCDRAYVNIHVWACLRLCIHMRVL